MSRFLNAEMAQMDAALERALRAGHDTSAIREAQAALQAVIAVAKSKNAQRAQVDAVARAGAAKSRAAERLAALIEPLKMNVSEMKEKNALDFLGDLDVAMDDLAEAELAASEFAPRLNDARAESRSMAERIKFLERQRQLIATRRAAGDLHVSDAGELALLDMDLQSLRAIESRAAASLARIESDAARLDADVTAARTRQKQVEIKLSVGCMLEQLTAMHRLAADGIELLDAVLRDADAPTGFALLPDIGRVASAADAHLLRLAMLITGCEERAQSNRRPSWGASRALRDQLQRLAIRRHEV